MFLLTRAILCEPLPYSIFIDMVSTVLWVHLTTYISFGVAYFLGACYTILLLSTFYLVLMPLIKWREVIGSHRSSNIHCMS